MHLAPLIRDLALIGMVAGLVTLIFHRIRQPVVLGYILAGVIVGPHTPPLPLVTDIANVQTLAEVGVIFLMFTLGLEFSFQRLVKTGRSSLVPTLIEVVGMLALGFISTGWLGWSLRERIFGAAIVAISSTTIIVKTFEEMGLKRKRFAEVVFGILIIEDLIAILILVALTTGMTGEFSGSVLLGASGRLLLVAGSWFVTGYFVVPRLIGQVGRFGSDETLILVSVAFCLGLAAIAAAFDYPTALGAFIMGSILSETRESRRIESLVAPLKNWFGAIFFVSVGMLIDPRILLEQKGSVLLLTAVVILGKTVSATLGVLIGGERLEIAIRSGMSLAQIGEFSFIIATLGLSLGVVGERLYPVAVAVSVLTTFITPYWVRLSARAAERFNHYTPEFMRKGLARYQEVWSHAGAEIAARRLRFWRWKFPRLSSRKMEGRLAPWDGHLVRMRVHPDSSVAGKPIHASALRKRLGLNVVVIQRGNRTWVAPSPDQMLFPQDELLVLGTDEQILNGQIEIEEPRAIDPKQNGEITDYSLQKLWILPGHPLCGRTIRQAGIREEQGGIVVGIERGGKRVMNPDSDLALQEDDVLWIVGPTLAPNGDQKSIGR